jgi:hypothetical protein
MTVRSPYTPVDEVQLWTTWDGPYRLTPVPRFGLKSVTGGAPTALPAAPMCLAATGPKNPRGTACLACSIGLKGPAVLQLASQGCRLVRFIVPRRLRPGGPGSNALRSCWRERVSAVPGGAATLAGQPSRVLERVRDASGTPGSTHAQSTRNLLDFQAFGVHMRAERALRTFARSIAAPRLEAGQACTSSDAIVGVRTARTNEGNILLEPHLRGDALREPQLGPVQQPRAAGH